MSVCIFGLGAYFYLDENEKDVSSLGWLPLVSDNHLYSYEIILIQFNLDFIFSIAQHFSYIIF